MKNKQFTKEKNVKFLNKKEKKSKTIFSTQFYTSLVWSVSSHTMSKEYFDLVPSLRIDIFTFVICINCLTTAGGML